MIKFRSFSIVIFSLCLVAYGAAYLSGVSGVPFHPDESSYLYMSNEIKPTLTHPASVFWSAQPVDGKRQTMRLLDPPLVHLLMDLGRRVAGLSPLPFDWNWEQTWQENQRAGVVPSPSLLWAGRMAVASLFPFSLALFFFAVRRVSGDFTAWAAVLLMASNALLLLHTRRAMAEGLLIFTLSLFLWTLFYAEKHPWIVAAAAALAFCAKQSLAPLALVGLCAIFWQGQAARRMALRLRQAALYAILGLAVVAAFYPVAWAQPYQAIRDAVRERQSLAEGHQAHYADQALPTLGNRLSAMVRQLFIAGPSFAEDPKYQAVTQASETAYLSHPLHTLFRSALAGGVLAALALLGMAGFFWRVRPAPGRWPRNLAWMWMVTVAEIAALLAAVPLEWQRYYIPLVPLACFWSAFGLNLVREWVAGRLTFRRPGATA